MSLRPHLQCRPTESGKVEPSAGLTTLAAHADATGSKNNSLHGLRELRLVEDADYRALWCYQRHRTRPSFTPDLIGEVRLIQAHLGSRFNACDNSVTFRPRFLVWASDLRKIYNLGGDLKNFTRWIRAGDRAALAAYAEACIEICWTNYVKSGCPIISVGMASGNALGGGLESLLSNDVVVVERQARFGFPEIGFGLFPGMGAYSLVSRLRDVRCAEDLVFSGRLISGEELHKAGLADILADEGGAEQATRKYMRRAARSFDAYRAIFAARRLRFNLGRPELEKIVSFWVDTALALGPGHLKLIESLVRAQDQRLMRLRNGQGDQSASRH